MKILLRILLIVLAVLSLLYFIGSVDDKETDSYSRADFEEEFGNKTSLEMKVFAGAYTIELKGSKIKDVEMYALNENGGAKWLWIENDGRGGANVDDEKKGTWSATENSITIDIQGNSGMITETYTLKNGLFYNNQFPKRYLKKVD